jgi:hypothetical protein
MTNHDYRPVAEPNPLEVLARARGSDLYEDGRFYGALGLGLNRVWP